MDKKRNEVIRGENEKDAKPWRDVQYYFAVKKSQS